jgi:hypothetical protein
MFVNSNESLASAPSTLPLRLLQEILHNRIIQKKGEIHTSIIIGLAMTRYGQR